MALNDAGYLERRAEHAMWLAQAAVHPTAVRAHYTMASSYLSRLYPPDNERPQPPNRFAAANRH